MGCGGSLLNTELNNVARNTDDTAKARALVAQGADLASTNGPHWRHTPLHQAAYHGRFEMAKTLVELRAPLHMHSNPCGRGSTGTPLELARGGGHIKIAEMLEQAMKNSPKDSTPTPSHGNPSSTSALNSELNNVARNTDDTAKARALVAQGADLASTNGPDWRHTPVHQAAYHGRFEMAKTLVELRASLHMHSNPCGRGATGTPLELARGGGHTKIAEMLEQAMSSGPKGSTPTPSQGNPASTSALNTELNNVARNTDDTAKARALVAQGADLASTNGPDWRHTPLHQAAYHGRFEMAKTLVELRAPLHMHSNPCGRGTTGTPLELARGGGHINIAQMLEQAMKSGPAAGPSTLKKPGEEPKPVVVMASIVDEGSGADSNRPGKKSRPLVEIVGILKWELGLDGNMTEVVNAAARELNVEKGSHPLTTLAELCLEKLGYDA